MGLQKIMNDKRQKKAYAILSTIWSGRSLIYRDSAIELLVLAMGVRQKTAARIVDAFADAHEFQWAGHLTDWLLANTPSFAVATINEIKSGPGWLEAVGQKWPKNLA